MEISSFAMANWSFGLVRAIERIVREKYSSKLRLWPLIQTFNFRGLIFNNSFLVIVLRDKLSGVPAGPSKPESISFTNHPSLPLDASNAETWNDFLHAHFSLNDEDAVFIVPIVGDGNDVESDYNQFSNSDKQSWQIQLSCILSRQERFVTDNNKQHVTNININQAPNARVNLNSIDQSSASINEVSKNKRKPKVFKYVAGWASILGLLLAIFLYYLDYRSFVPDHHLVPTGQQAVEKKRTSESSKTDVQQEGWEQQPGGQNDGQGRGGQMIIPRTSTPPPCPLQQGENNPFLSTRKLCFQVQVIWSLECATEGKVADIVQSGVVSMSGGTIEARYSYAMRPPGGGGRRSGKVDASFTVREGEMQSMRWYEGGDRSNSYTLKSKCFPN